MRKLLITILILLTVFSYSETASMANDYSTELASASSKFWSITDGDQTSLDFTSAFSLMAWIKTVDATDFQVIASKNAGGGGAYAGYYFAVLADELRLLTGNGILVQGGTISDNTWHHVAGTCDSSGNLEIYIDGSSAGTAAKSVPVDGVWDFNIGARHSDSAYWDGKIDEVSAWNVELTSTQVSNNYNSGDGVELAGNETNLVGSWRFENNSDDGTSNNNDLTNNNSCTFSSDVPFAGSSPSATEPKKTEVIIFQ